MFFLNLTNVLILSMQIFWQYVEYMYVHMSSGATGKNCFISTERMLKHCQSDLLVHLYPHKGSLEY